MVSREQYERAHGYSEVTSMRMLVQRAPLSTAPKRVSKWILPQSKRRRFSSAIAPFAHQLRGRAGQRLVDVGNVVNPGGSSNNNSSNSGTTPNTNALLVIERLDPIYADFTISQNSLAEVQQQMRANKLVAEVRLPDEAGSPVNGQLTFSEQFGSGHNWNCDSARYGLKLRSSLLARTFR